MPVGVLRGSGHEQRDRRAGKRGGGDCDHDRAAAAVGWGEAQHGKRFASGRWVLFASATVASSAAYFLPAMAYVGRLG